MRDLTNQITKAPFTDYEQFIDFSTAFFATSTLHKTTSKKWNILTTDYKFSQIEGKPAVSFTDATLICVTPKDSFAIYRTKGDYFPGDEKWEGQSGKVTWERVGLDPNSVYAEFGAYNVDMKLSDYKAESVVFYHKKYFNRPLKGIVKDKITSRVEGEYLYPQFISYELDIVMKNIAPQATFSSGFSMQGSRMVSFGTQERRAMLDFFSTDGRMIMSARSTSFAIKENEEVNSQNTEASIYFGKNSIYHPRLTLSYKFDDKELQLIRDGKASSRIAFVSSYHKLEGDVDALFWKINTPVIDFKMVSQLKNLRVAFKSYDYYDKKRMDSYRAVTEVDVIAKLRDFSEGGETEMSANDFAKYLKSSYSVESVLNTIFQLVAEGFIFYNPETEIMTIRPKVVNYMNARRGLVDYDRISLVSESDMENAQLDLDTKELLVTGVKKVSLSDSQNVVIYPQAGIVRTKKNRDMDVDGTIVAGSVDFTGKNFAFEYDPFDIKLDSIDQMQIYIEDKTGKHKTVNGKLAPVSTLVRDVTGTLYIDKEDNKSGKKKHPSYPRFESKGNAYLYYNSKKLYDGAYNKDTFYFKLKPFEFADLDEIEPEKLVFPGTMVTGGIFPPFEQETKLQDDLSLGFTRTTDANGMPTYQKGQFYGTVMMSDKGLTGDGRLDYMAAKMTAKPFTFMPNSMFATANSFYQERKMVKGVDFPEAHNSNVALKWLPKGDSLLVLMKDKPFQMFADKSNLKGHLLLTDKGLKGTGTMNLPEASIRAREFVYAGGSFKSDSADVVIKNQDAARVSFNSRNVKARVDMDKSLGEFLANGDNIPINLPYNQYATVASEFYWLMNDRIVNIRMPEDTAGGYFVSTHPDQDNLKFKAAGGVVNLAENTIKVDSVRYIAVGDAKIQPPDTQVFIEGDAKIRTFEDAVIVADSINEYHKITRATVTIKGKNKMDAKGEYRYKGKNLKKQQVEFDPIEVKQDEEEKKRYFTYAKANIPEGDDFKLNNRISFKGNCMLDSRKQFLYFDGFAKLELVSKSVASNWFSFADEINPDDVQIDVSTPIAENRDTLIFGIMQDMANLEPYPAFLTQKRTPLDRYIFRATGELNHDAEQNIYKVGKGERIKGTLTTGNLLTLKDNEDKMTANGRFTLGNDWGLVEVSATGQADYTAADSSFKINDAVMGLEYFFDKELSTKMGETIRKYNGEGTEIDYSKESFLQGASQLVEEKSVPDLKKMMGQYGYLAERIKGLDQTLILTSVDMVWDTTSRTLRSVGKFGVAYIGEKYVNRMVDGYLEFGQRQGGDFFNLYIETMKNDEGAKQWYYWYYKNGVLQLLSSDVAFNDAVLKIAEKKRTKVEKGLIYNYTLAPQQKRNMFVYAMRGEAPPPEPTPAPPAPATNDGSGSETTPTPDPNQPTDGSGTQSNPQPTDGGTTANPWATPTDGNGETIVPVLPEPPPDMGKKSKKKKKGEEGKDLITP